jgi:hypothetical protein
MIVIACARSSRASWGGVAIVSSRSALGPARRKVVMPALVVCGNGDLVPIAAALHRRTLRLGNGLRRPRRTWRWLGSRASVLSLAGHRAGKWETPR